MRKIYYFLFVIVIFITMAGCVTVDSHLTPLQRKTMESKELEGTYEDAVKSTISVLQDKGYEIKNSDYQGGIIYAESSNSIGYGGSESYSVTINFEKFTETIVKMRLSIHRQLYNAISAKRQKFFGHISGIVNDPKLYQDFYNEVQNEMFRRAQLNK